MSQAVRPFSDLAVIEIAGAPAGAYAGKLFADYGARVFTIEPPTGDPLRLAGEDWHGTGTLFRYLNTSKRSITLDLADDAGRAGLDRLLDVADVVIQSAAPGPLAPLAVEGGRPRLVSVVISPFGLTGPYAAYRSNPFTDDAIGGHLYLNGEPDREPIRRPGFHSAYQAGTHAFVGALAALHARERSGPGQTVEVSHLEGLASMHQHTTAMWSQAGFIPRRSGNTEPGPWHPNGIYPCRDGFVSINAPSNAQVEALLAVFGLSGLLEDARFAEETVRGEHKRDFDDALRPWLNERTVTEVVALGQGVFVPVGPVPTMLELLEDEHLRTRGYWRSVGVAPFPLRYPGGPFRVEGHDAAITPPPALGECSLDAAIGACVPVVVGMRDRAEPASGPLDGLRVLDLTRVWAGPFATRLLGDLGADVLKVEAPFAREPRFVPPEVAARTHLYPDDDPGARPWNRNATFNTLNRNKRGITLRLDTPRGRAVFEGLVRRSDVVIENYAPRVMPQLGLDDERLRDLNPGLIHVSMPGYGASGPKRDWTALGPLIEAGAGVAGLMGYRGGGPYRSGVAWPDPAAGLAAVAGLLVALRDREADPARRGRVVEVAMIEAALAFVGDELLASQARGADLPRDGNRDSRSVPQGCYPCAGDDRWIAISVGSDGEWAALCLVASFGAPWRGLTRQGRAERGDEVDAMLSAWTSTQEAHALMGRLQGAGIVACAVSDARDLSQDPHLSARGFWTTLDHEDVGPRVYPGIAVRLSRTPATSRYAAPLLGEHNHEVLRDLLGMSPEEVADLAEEGTIGWAPPA